MSQDAKDHYEKAIMLETSNGENNDILFHYEEALRLGGLAQAEELNCHLNIGLINLDLKKYTEGFQHLEKTILSDPNFKFVNEDLRELIKNKVYSGLCAAYQMRAREIKTEKDIVAATWFLEQKAMLLSDRCAPSIYLELGSYYGIQGNEDKAKDTINKALTAPTYESDFQKNAAMSAQNFIGETKQEKSKGCFIATACYGSFLSQEVIILQQFRDEYLLASVIGRKFISAYNLFSPSLARKLVRHPQSKKIIRLFVIEPLIFIVKRYFPRNLK